MVSRWRWQEFYAQYVARTLRKRSPTAQSDQPGAAEDFSADAALACASMVLSGDLTLGQRSRFDHLGVCHPALVRLSTIWQNIQELRVSFERLADVIDTPENQMKLINPR